MACAFWPFAAAPQNSFTSNLHNLSPFSPFPHWNFGTPYLTTITILSIIVGRLRSFQYVSAVLMRRTSVSLPTRNVAHDPHEKPARYMTKGASNGAVGTVEKIKTAWMTQSQRSRYLKTGGILLFVVFLFYWLSPSGSDVYSESTFCYHLLKRTHSNTLSRPQYRKCRRANAIRLILRNSEVLEV